LPRVAREESGFRVSGLSATIRFRVLYRARLSRSSKRKRWIGGELRRGEVPGQQARPGGGGDHGGVVCGERERREGDLKSTMGCFGGEAGAKLAVGGDSAGDEDSRDVQ
jgi:hypothetical protein